MNTNPFFSLAGVVDALDDGFLSWVCVGHNTIMGVGWDNRSEQYESTPNLRNEISVRLVPSEWGVVYAIAEVLTADRTADRKVYDGLDVHVLQLDTLTWRRVEQEEGDIWPSPRRVYTFACIDGGLVIAGGLTQDSCSYNPTTRVQTNGIWRLDSESETWQVLGALPSHIREHIREDIGVELGFNVVGNTIITAGLDGCASVHLYSSSIPEGPWSEGLGLLPRGSQTRLVGAEYSLWPEFNVRANEWHGPVAHVFRHISNGHFAVTSATLCAVGDTHLRQSKSFATLLDLVGRCPYQKIPQPPLQPFLESVLPLPTEKVRLSSKSCFLINAETLLVELECFWLDSDADSDMDSEAENDEFHEVKVVLLVDLLPALFSPNDIDEDRTLDPTRLNEH
ncbi:hypothetical protein KIPB_008697 [Kipferlia bialata]|uniref:Uncharacterized protein n=1 Tax=Kipferlia bialata TaxID=797122 RepID=A0A9K3D3S7_9EUKA|nr:hypothetical protein KIPB_008697 [Kipferlia bialata]|eukprot:g8697.t1